MVEKLTPHGTANNSQYNNTHLLFEIARHEYGETTAAELNEFVADLISLYKGKWPTREACQVGYHTIDHALDVTLAAARMAAGWNMTDREHQLPESVFRAGLAAALFHDSGYVKDKNDSEGHGGKFTFNHVERSVQLAREYLTARWPDERIELVCRMIDHTDFLKETHSAPQQTAGGHETLMACIVATADLIAQMADVDYLAKIHDLFEEFEEAYRFEGKQSLAARGIRVYSSAQEILDGTLAFYEQFVVPRLESLGRMDRFLNAFFVDGRNPYQENIAANISYHYKRDQLQWQRLGEILEQLGVVSHAQIVQAVKLQAGEETANGAAHHKHDAAPSDQLLTWAGQKSGKQRLGEILLAMEAIDQEGLCQGLIAQTLPPSLLKTLSGRELSFLLQAVVLLQNISQGITVLEYLVKMTAAFMECESGTVQMFDMNSGETVILVATGPLAGSVGARLPLDKNLAGWVQRYGLPVKINHDQLHNTINVTHGRSDKNKIQSVLMTPLLVNGERFGVFELVNKRNENFTEHETEIISCLANIIGSSLSNFLLGLE
jgi:HD superfamily phosphodiesterase